MDMAVILLRLIHILSGVFWAGTLIFTATMLIPSIRDAGPGGAGVMPALMRRHFFNIMPVVAVLTVLSGIDLMRRVSAGFSPDWFTSSSGMTLTVGSTAAVIALVIGVGVMRVAALRMSRLAKEVADTTDASIKDARQAEIAALQQRLMVAGRLVAGLLVVAVGSMAIARYMG